MLAFFDLILPLVFVFFIRLRFERPLITFFIGFQLDCWNLVDQVVEQKVAAIDGSRVFNLGHKVQIHSIEPIRMPFEFAVWKNVPQANVINLDEAKLRLVFRCVLRSIISEEDAIFHEVFGLLGELLGRYWHRFELDRDEDLLQLAHSQVVIVYVDAYLIESGDAPLASSSISFEIDLPVT